MRGRAQATAVVRRAAAARATSVDVARAAGVSQAAVSLVLNGRAVGRVSVATQERVRLAAETLGYRANAAAQSLRLGRARTVALVVPDIRNPFFAAVLRGAERVARRTAHAVVLIDTDNRRGWQTLAQSALAGGAVDGFVLCAVAAPRGPAFAGLRKRLVMLDAAERRLPSVQLDIVGGTRAALGHLVALGHRRIGHLGAALPHATFARRAQEYRRVLQQAGLPVEAALERQAPIDPDAARPIARELLEQRERPTAVFCDDDVLAAALYKAAHDLGLTIPRDVSVVGFDDIALARLLEPELTTVAVPAERLGQVGMERLLAALSGEATAATPKLRVRLVVRGSTAPPLYV